LYKRTGLISLIKGERCCGGNTKYQCDNMLM
jgi:hypothetical protein